MLTLSTTILRDGLERDVTVEFTANCTLRAARACWDDPGYPAEYETAFVSAALDHPEPDDHGLTDAEMATLRTWFRTNEDKVWHAANDNFDAGPDPDDARDRLLDDRGWRGLEA
jgi:hypothetical protein